ncbi:unnamed protein product [Didymodactylos carnosus]|uniref:Uncharacterized protein n=1 Tax=Didymodactylos carnosus TaxID=1234261 RepID=A0A813QWE4_9BILA|nr:unnamed protein product [Didymodactylos carnosus]CAF0774227.1 unnamed protein product [Didymodactylos carnosus]CAF3555317.1 unnamed protein product [Didymodactylos carnosus]CAF3555319.1 unnamed protein product [Didymodactylos carnosus]
MSTARITSTTTTTITIKKKDYKEPCEDLLECYIEYGLLCEFGYNESRYCLCEGSHYWSVAQHKCVRKGELNVPCEIDYQCHTEIGLVCDTPPGSSEKICICSASLYWSTDSNCGQTKIKHIINCKDEPHATTCLVLDDNNLYHMLTVRSVTKRELSFDWFLIDEKTLSNIESLSCGINNGTKYCFGLNKSLPHSLELAQFTYKGFHSIENIGGSNIGIPFALEDIGTVSAYVRDARGVLYRQVISDDEVLSPKNISTIVSSDAICYIRTSVNPPLTYCYALNAENTVIEFLEQSPNVWKSTLLGNTQDHIQHLPICNYIGLQKTYCFALLDNKQIQKNIFSSGQWGVWSPVGSKTFLTEPLFFTSKPNNASSADQTCYLLGIDINYELQLSENKNCAFVESWTEWTKIPTTVKFQQFQNVFRLRDDNMGAVGVSNQGIPYYIFLDPITKKFTSPSPAFSVKPVLFRP